MHDEGLHLLLCVILKVYFKIFPSGVGGDQTRAKRSMGIGLFSSVVSNNVLSGSHGHSPFRF